MKTSAGRVDVLLVDDNPDDCFLMLRQLLRSDPSLEVGVCHNGKEALSLLSDPDRPLPKVVFLDLELGEVNGHEIVTKIRANERTRALPVVILTGGPVHEDVLLESYRLGANSCIRKPMSAGKRNTVGLAGLYWARRNLLPEK